MLGEILVKKGLVTEDKLKEALDAQQGVAFRTQYVAITVDGSRGRNF